MCFRGSVFIILAMACARVAYAQQSEPTPALYVFPAEQLAVPLTQWRTQAGDSVGWADPSFDDSRWEQTHGTGLWVSAGWKGKDVRWLRKELFLPEPMDPLDHLAIYQRAAVSASEVYWDGVLIGRNGRVGSGLHDEKPGRSAMIFPIPRELTHPGRHVITQRISNYSTFSGVVETPMMLGEFGRLQRLLFWDGVVQFFMAGVFFFTGLFHLVMLFGYRDRKPYAVFATFCLACASHIFIQALREFFRMDLGLYYAWAAVNDVPWFLMMWLLPVFFMYEFGYPRKIRNSMAIASVALVVVGAPRLVTTGLLPVSWIEPFVLLNTVHSYLTIVLAAGVCVWAMVRRAVGSLASTLGLVAFLAGVLATHVFELDLGWMLGFVMLITFLTVSLSRQMSQREREFQQAQVRAARLELDLLKRHIQPHFLLNSLNSIVAWLEEDPGTAVKLVQALAEEMRMMLEFAAHRSVALSDEVRLCAAHLQVMGFRYARKYRFETEGAMAGVEIPPLVIHTLVENGLTHGYAGRDEGVFKLACKRNGQSTRIELFNDGMVAADSASGAIREGTGTRYVRGRLQELFGSRWSFVSSPTEGGWSSVIEVKS
jgi:hypothetical protein